MNWKLPNQLTVGRILLAAGFFVLLGLYEQGSDWGCWLLNAAFGIYLLAGITDVLDGYFARKWKLVSAFGRIADPFVDKVLVVGAFVMLTGLNYAQDASLVGQYERDLPAWLTGGMASCVQAWMVVAIMAREFIISAIRGYNESRGVKFPATSAGKIKMFVQSAAICIVLFQLANLPDTEWAIWTKIIAVWAAVVVTVVSGLIYLRRARGLMASDNDKAS